MIALKVHSHYRSTKESETKRRITAHMHFERLRIDGAPALLNSAMKEFKWDGALLDVYIDNTTPKDWQTLIDFVRKSDLKWKFTITDKSTALPESVEAIFQRRDDAPTCLSITVDSIELRSYFFSPDDIDFDLDPRQVNNVESVQRLFQLLRRLSDVLGRDVVLTPEGGRTITADGSLYMTLFRIAPGQNNVEHRLSE